MYSLVTKLKMSLLSLSRGWGLIGLAVLFHPKQTGRLFLVHAVSETFAEAFSLILKLLVWYVYKSHTCLG